MFKLTAVNQSVTGDGGEVGIAVLTEWIAYERLKEVQAVVVPLAMGAYGGLTRDERAVWGTVLELVGDERKMEDWSERQR